jgi:hypothetical protein
MTHLRAVAFIGICVPLLAACSTSTRQRQLLLGFAEYDEARRSFRHVSPGVGLRLGGDLDGLDLGWSDVLVVRPSDPGSQNPRGSDGGTFSPPLGWTWRARDGLQRWLGLVLVSIDVPSSSCVFVARSAVGSALGLSSRFAGLGVGVTHQTELTADPSAAGAYLLEYSSKRPRRCRLTNLRGEL